MISAPKIAMSMKKLKKKLFVKKDKNFCKKIFFILKWSSYLLDTQKGWPKFFKKILQKTIKNSVWSVVLHTKIGCTFNKTQ